MNEKLNYSSFYTQMFNSRFDHALARQVMQFDTKQTQDISGNFNVGVLNSSASFPFEYNRARELWNSSRVLKDINEGRHGNSVYMRSNAKVSANIASDLVQKMKTKGQMTAELWVNTVDSPSMDVQIMRIPGVFDLSKTKWWNSSQYIRLCNHNN